MLTHRLDDPTRAALKAETDTPPLEAIETTVNATEIVTAVEVSETARTDIGCAEAHAVPRTVPTVTGTETEQTKNVVTKTTATTETGIESATATAIDGTRTVVTETGTVVAES